MYLLTSANLFNVCDFFPLFGELLEDVDEFVDDEADDDVPLLLQPELIDERRMSCKTSANNF